MAIHPAAHVHPKAEIGKDVEIGPNTVIGEKVRIGNGTDIANNVTITGNTEMGENNIVYSGAVIGSLPQIINYTPDNDRVIIGNNNVFREFVTINTGSKKFGGETSIGDNNMVMACAHIAHDCHLENGIIMDNNVLLAGHIKVEDHAIISGASAIHHFTTVGTMAFIGGLTRIVHDVPPYMIVEGNPSQVRSINVVGLRRHGVSEDKIAALKEAHRLIYRSELTRNEAIEELESQEDRFDEIQMLIDFLKNMDNGKHGRAREALREQAK